MIVSHHRYDAMMYPLLNTRGEDGYTFSDPTNNQLGFYRQVNPTTGVMTDKPVSCKDFYAYLLQKRPGESNHLLNSGHLLNMWLVDQYIKVESERLAFLRSHQDQLRVEQYSKIQDALQSDAGRDPNEIGKRTILPSTYVGSPRDMMERCQDALRYCQVFGSPDLFITMTANPK